MDRSNRSFLVLAVVFALTMLVTPFIGRVAVTGEDVLSLFSDQQAVFWTLRVPRLCMAVLAGASLSLAGATLQAVFRNPLATPYTLGVSSGAALAVAACLAAGVSGMVGGLPVLTLAAFGGAMVVVVFVYAVANARRGFSTATLLLAGVSIGFICSTGILLIEYFSNESVTNATVKWLMGSVVVAGFNPILECIPLVVISMGGIWYLHRDLDLIMMGDLVAAARGVHVVRSRRLAYFAASAMTGAVVAHTGPIGFVGLVVPHVMRHFVGANHRRLIPACLLAGGTFLPICDTLARQSLYWIQGSSLEIPVGILTNLLGGFFFLYILLTSKQESPIA